jgi:hypothetical protein
VSRQASSHRAVHPSTLLALLLGIALPGCGDDAQGGGARVDSVPLFFRMTGEAMGTDDLDRTGTCGMDLIFEIVETERTDEHVLYTGTHGGELARSVLEADESGLAFFIDVFGEVEIELLFPDTLIIDIPLNDTPESRFYQRLSHFEGVIDQSGAGEGPWECAPLDIDQGGYVDDTVTVEGTWMIAPEPS